ncbi:HD domain-containing protein [bacterium]|nr:HD domain-containing protein [bacterium]
MKMITLEEIKSNEHIKELITHADKALEQIGYTEHGFRHVKIVSKRAGQLLRDLGYDERRIQLAEISGYMHDVGNVVNRRSHAQHSAHIVMNLLPELGMDFGEVLEIASAVGNHHEEEGDVVSDISAALIIADKSDVHRSRVRNPNTVAFDIHDRVNYSARDSKLIVSNNATIELSILIDPDISSVMEYFEIFMARMVEARKAAKFLNKKFELVINGIRLT